MEALINFFNIVLYQPLINALILLYTYLPGKDLGMAIIVFTVLIKLILSPLSLKSIRSQRALSRLQPKLKEIQQKYKNDREAQSKALMELYQKEKVNPLSGCLPLLLQLLVLIALYQVFLKGLNPEVLKESLYSFVPYPGKIHLTLFWKIPLEHPKANLVFAFLASVLQFIQTKVGIVETKEQKQDFSTMFQNQMLYFFPVLTFFIIWKLGSVIGLYWIVSTIFSIGEHYFVLKKYSIYIK